jgi:hypothetical protein
LFKENWECAGRTGTKAQENWEGVIELTQLDSSPNEQWRNMKTIVN